MQYAVLMRTTVEIRVDQRARLLELAARRREKGFSGLVQEALDTYFERVDDRQTMVKDAVAVLGTLNEEAARHLEATAAELRGSWR